MKMFFQKLFNLLNISRRDLFVFTMSLLLAFSIWLIHNLSLSYNGQVSMPVIASSNLDYRSNLSSNTCIVYARARTTGYNLIRLNNVFEEKAKVVNFDKSNLHYYDEDTYYITSSELVEYAHLIYGESVKVEYIVSDTLKFRFTPQDHKKVPVKAVTLLTMAPQYSLTEEFKVEPDSITVYGDSHLLESVESVSTEPLRFYDVKSSFQGEVDIQKIKGLRFSQDQVNYKANVTRYIELTENIKVQARNVPEDKDFKFYPSSVSVTFRTVFPLKEKTISDVALYVDYNDYVKSLSGKCPIHISGLSKEILDYQIHPENLGCVANDRL
jgi:hypothetical protein